MSNADPSLAHSRDVSIGTAPQDAFPAVYRREKWESPLSDVEDGGPSVLSGGPSVSVQATSAARETALAATTNVEDLERLVYVPMPENRKLGYISVASLIINKMIGQ